MAITSIKFKNFKALRDYSISLHRMNVLVGPNNCGKSTVLSAFRVLEQAIRTGRSRRATRVLTHHGHLSDGHIIPEKTIPIPLENVHSDYIDSDSRIEIRYSNGNRLFLLFPSDGGVTMYWDANVRPATPSKFSKAFPDQVYVIPVLGPVEQDEIIVTEDTVKRAAGTPRASRHFRNYWMKYPDGFTEFKNLVQQTWPGMSIALPEVSSNMERKLTMFVAENRIDRELYWAGLGFQIWCQLLTYISRYKDADVLIVDEPEIYLHPEIQRQLLGILRAAKPDIILATHSSEILGEADPSEILLIDKTKRSARRLQDIDGVQQALDSIGSIQNITLTELARNSRLAFLEGSNDYKIVRRFAKVLGYHELAAGTGLTMFESGGFESWPKVQALAWGFRKTLTSKLRVAAIYDRDYRCDQESVELKRQLENDVAFAHFHGRKEIENYLLNIDVLERTARKLSSVSFDIEEILERATHDLKTHCIGRYVSSYCKFFRNSGKDPATLTSEALTIYDSKWPDLSSRLEIVPGKDVLRAARNEFQTKYGITLTDIRIVDSFRPDEIPLDMVELIRKLDEFRVNGPSG